MAISWTDLDVTATINMPSPLGAVYVTGSSVTFTIPKVQAKATGSYMTPPFYLGIGQRYEYGSGWYDAGYGLELKNGSTTIKELRGHSSKSVAKNTYVDIAYSTSASVTLTTSSYFKSTNPTARTVTLNLVAPQYCIVSPYEPSTGSSLACTNPSAKTLSTITLMLDVPPTATVSAISYDTPYVYAGLTTASVTVSDVSAKYGGNITDVTLTIGSQTASISGNGTLSILLNASGTFTPVVTVTDSRGQVQEYRLDDITVGTYSTPTVNFDAQRTTNTGVLDDEGACATIVTTLTFDPIAEAVAPTVSITDEDGNVVADGDISITWYSSRNGTLSGVISDWSTVASGSTVYGLISITGDFDTQKAYVISLTPQDSEGITGDAKTDTLQTAFYTVDFLAGGHGIAFGQPASQDGFFCNMPANFVDANDVMRALFDFVYPVGSYYETSDTSFDPNITWGGTWELETAGQVHISAGTGYAVDGALRNETDGGSTTHLHSTGNFTLGVNHIPSHTHAIAQRSGSGQTFSNWHFELAVNNSNGPVYNTNATNNRSTSAIGYTGGGQAHNHGDTGNSSNMQPYIIVNRWHRTA